MKQEKFMSPKRITEDLLQMVTHTIVRRFSPERIILFGSSAKGETQANSDIDLFIIWRSRLRRDNRSLAISKLFPDRKFAMDSIVYTPREVEQSLQRGNFFIKEILEEGRVLYEKKKFKKF